MIEKGTRVKVLHNGYGVPEKYVGVVGIVVYVRPSVIHGKVYRVKFGEYESWEFIGKDIAPTGIILNK